MSDDFGDLFAPLPHWDRATLDDYLIFCFGTGVRGLDIYDAIELWSISNNIDVEKDASFIYSDLCPQGAGIESFSPTWERTEVKFDFE